MKPAETPEPVMQLGSRIEARLANLGVTLTMGGEPTFVPLEPAGAEWSTDALGPTKLSYARRFAREILSTVYPGALVMQVFGKWYPGEVLPRWNLMVLGPSGADPLWREPDRLLLENRPGSNRPEVAKTWLDQLIEDLGLDTMPIPAFNAKRDRGEAGWVLPLDQEKGAWKSDRWETLRDERLVLFAGDSPVGLRIPLAELGEDALKRALTVEVRDGAFEIFIPPLETEAFRELIGRIQTRVLSMDLRDILLCGYVPADLMAHFEVFGLAADPGVLEVNLPPQQTWEGYRSILGSAVTAAERVGLSLTKYGLNGIIHGSGGGSHLAFGGPPNGKNPFLEDPRRIASFLRYVQHHPVLSYAFTGRFVGPGSQAPRVDEGPRHGLYELEVACEGLEAAAASMDGPMIDQFLRNLMTDAAGNTHRAEICFDKFHNLSAPNGIQGIVELRAFETLGRAEDLGRVALLLRAVMVRLFEAPFAETLRRHGVDLHDRFFLPAFLWQDLEVICEDLRVHGIPFDPEWMRPTFEFRFPEYGRLKLPGSATEVRIRQALESWPLMAEESRGTATIRVVDNSTDRLELSLAAESGVFDAWAFSANGIDVPFSRVGDQWVAGLRYKCASAYPALHPHVPIQSPLRLEWVERKTGCVRQSVDYHYWEPDGGVYDSGPADAVEAANRRSARWIERPDREGENRELLPARMAPEFTFTLDLRRQHGGGGGSGVD